MPVFEFTSPEGKTYTVEGPQGATQEQAFQILQGQMGAEKPKRTLASEAMGSIPAQMAMGALRGAGSIGATLKRPFDLAEEYLAKQAGSTWRAPDRRTSMDEALQGMGADTSGLSFGAGKLGAEIAGTAGVGGLLAKAAPAAWGQALTTGGMTGGNLLGRSLAAGAVGGASAGLVGDNVGTGAAIGAAMPGAFKAAGAVGGKAGSMLRGPEVAPETMAAAQRARELGLVMPPTQVKSSFANRALEGYAGKLTTAQNASAKNAPIINEVSAKALGLPPGTALSPEVLGDVRKGAGQAYEAIKGTGIVQPGQAYDKALDAIASPYVTAAKGFPGAKPSPILEMVESLRSPEFDASSAVEMVKKLREDATKAYTTGDKATGKAIRAASDALEDTLEAHLKQIGQPELLNQFRDARQLIAKTYSVEGALNKTTGTVDARKLAGQIQRGKPLTGELRDIGEFAGRFPTAAKTPESMGSLPQTSPLDWGVGGVASMAHGNPLPLLATLLGRPIARSAALGNTVQNRMVSPQETSRFIELLRQPAAEQLMYRTLPIAQ